MAPDLEEGSRARGAEDHHDEHDEGDQIESEDTPLLHHESNEHERDPSRPYSSASSILRAFQTKPISDRRWPSIIALFALCLVVVGIICFGFVAPSVIEEYANSAVTFEPTALSIDSFTMHGVRARVQGDITIDADRVQNHNIRRLGRFATWVATEVESGNTQVKVTLPGYDDVVLGTAQLPPISVAVRNGHTTHVDFVTELRPGQLDSIKELANDWIHGRLTELQVVGRARVPIRSGFFRFGTHELVQELVFVGKNVPAIPNYEITRLDLHNIDDSRAHKGIAADVSLSVENPYPVSMNIPSMAFQISVRGCSDDDKHIALADATTTATNVVHDQPMQLDVTGLVQSLPESLLRSCPGMPDSPLDLLVARYIQGQKTTLFARGSDTAVEGTPDWLGDIISDVTVPVPFQGHALGHLIRDFSLTNVDFGLPNPLADPDADNAQATISAIVNATINLPAELNFDLAVHRVKADADVFYHDAKLGELDLSHWQKANSTRIGSAGMNDSGLVVQSTIDGAPLRITDDDVFSDVFQALLLGSADVILDIKAKVDVAVETALGEFVLRRIPATAIGKDADMDKIDIKVDELRILGTTSHSLTLAALVNFTNPTEYSAMVPYLDVLISHNGSDLGHATARSVRVQPGLNINLPITAIWDPMAGGGEKAHKTGIELLSRYVSGEETLLTIHAHNASIPSNPSLSYILSKYSIEIPAPRLLPPGSLPSRPREPKHPKNPDRPEKPSDPNDPEIPGGDDDDRPSFIKDATMHLFSSTAVVVLLNPLAHTELTVTYINATALYDSEPVGRIKEYSTPFVVAPGGERPRGTDLAWLADQVAKQATSRQKDRGTDQGIDRLRDADSREGTASPRLPVTWVLGSVGYDAVRGALGGTLKLQCEATVGIRVGKWEERIRFRGHGIGAKIRL